MSRNARRILAPCALLVLGGCAVVAPVGEVPPGGMATECDGAQLAFADDATLAEVGLPDFGAPGDANRRGFIQITAAPIVPDGPPGGAIGVEPTRWLCVTWPDGSGMGGSIPEEWQLPERGGENRAPEEAAQGGPQVLPILLAALVVAGAGVTLIAFGGERSS